MNSLEQYIKNYYVLIPNGFNIYKALKGTSTYIGGFFGLGSILSKVLPDQTIEVTNVKKRKILSHIRSNQLQFEKSIRNVKKYVDQHMVPELERVDNSVKPDFEILFTKDETLKNSTDHYYKYNRHFINYFQKLIATKKLAKTISKSLSQVLDAQKQVILLTSDKQKIGKESAVLLELAQSLNQIKILIPKSELRIEPIIE